MTELRIIGKPIPQHDAWEKAFGLTKYAADFSMPRSCEALMPRPGSFLSTQAVRDDWTVSGLF